MPQGNEEPIVAARHVDVSLDGRFKCAILIQTRGRVKTRNLKSRAFWGHVEIA